MRFWSHRTLHRLTGICVALPLLVFVATGLPLQFTAELRLGSQGVSLAWVQDRYGVEAPAQVTVLPDVQQAEVLQADATLMTATRQMTVSGRLLGAYSMPQWTIFATSEELLIIPNIEQVPVERLALPQTITAFGRTDDPYLLIESSAGIEFSADLGLTWRHYTGAAGVWQIPSFRAPTRQEAQRYAATQLSWERLLQDLHSGRFFGQIGVWFMSFAGLALVVLSFTGLYLWCASKRFGR